MKLMTKKHNKKTIWNRVGLRRQTEMGTVNQRWRTKSRASRKGDTSLNIWYVESSSSLQNNIKQA
jgi:hypothetical protein